MSIVNTLRAAGCVFAEDEARLLIAAATTTAELQSMLERRVSGLPLEHILGWAEFGGLRVAVDPGVFVPRRRTELLVDEAAALLRSGSTVVDLGCGTGALGAALRSRVDVELYAVDIDPVAVGCARRNLVDRFAGPPLAAPVVLLGDLYQPLPDDLRGNVGAIMANTPYVPTGAIRLLPAEAREHEPRVALDGGVDGLQVQRRVVAGAPGWLAPGGHLLIETSEDQAPAVSALMLRHGLTASVSHCDDRGATVVVGRAPLTRAQPRQESWPGVSGRSGMPRLRSQEPPVGVPSNRVDATALPVKSFPSTTPVRQPPPEVTRRPCV